MSDHKRIVRNYIDRVWNLHDYTAIDENIRPDYIQHFPNVPPGREGVRGSFTGMSLLRIEDGKFAELWVEQDLAGLLQQLQG